jgi:dephospho-CoA kinase
MIIGITGKSGSGKSTVAQKFAKMSDAYYLDLDSVFHDEIEKRFDFVVETFGEQILDSDGGINRKKIGDLIFSNRVQYDTYTKEIYLSALSGIEQGIAFYAHKTIILDHILLPHMPELWSQCDIKILVDADWEIRRMRIISRDNLPMDYIMKRESASIDYNYSDFNVILKNNHLDPTRGMEIYF